MGVFARDGAVHFAFPCEGQVVAAVNAAIAVDVHFPSDEKTRLVDDESPALAEPC